MNVVTKWEKKSQKAQSIVNRIERKIRALKAGDSIVKFNPHIYRFAKAVYREKAFTEYDRLAIIDKAYRTWPMSPVFMQLVSSLQVAQLTQNVKNKEIF